MKKMLLNLMLLVVTTLIISSHDAKSQTKVDTLRIIFNEGYMPYSIGNKFTVDDLGNDQSIYKGRFINYLKDFPELKQFARKNFWRDIEFAIRVVNCYNSYMQSTVKPTVNEAYFKSFGIYTKKAMRKGPTADMLAVKKPINFLIKTMSTSTTYTYSTTKNGSYGERFRGYFSYGASGYYKKGFLCSNIKRALGDDRKAIRYINKYRRTWVRRTVILSSGVGLVTIAFRLLNEKPFFGLNDDAVPFFAAPAVIILNAMVRGGNNYKTKCIESAIITYNMNLGLNPTADRKADSLISLLKPWDYAKSGMDTVMKQLLDLGPAVAKKVFPLLDKPQNVASAHTMLSIIFYQPTDKEYRDIYEGDKVIGYNLKLNGLKWKQLTTQNQADQYILDEKSYKKIKKRWQKIVM